MRITIGLVAAAAFFLYLGASQVAELATVSGVYPPSYLIGSFAPGTVLLLLAVRRLFRAVHKERHLDDHHPAAG